MTTKPHRLSIDLPPMPFDSRITGLAMQLKRLGLIWTPHVGCFVWDPDRYIEASSPFPDRIYFILDLSRFLDIFGSVSAIQQRLVWLPTWHQARLLCSRLDIEDSAVSQRLQCLGDRSPVTELVAVYEMLIGAMTAMACGRFKA